MLLARLFPFPAFTYAPRFARTEFDQTGAIFNEIGSLARDHRANLLVAFRSLTFMQFARIFLS